MLIIRQLSELALYPFFGDGSRLLSGLVSDRFSDCSQRLPKALQTANTRAWKTLEISLAGQSWWQRCMQDMTRTAEEKSLRNQIQAFLKHVPLPGHASDEAFCQCCLAELRAANKANHIPGLELEQDDLEQLAMKFQRYGNSAQLLEAEQRGLEKLIADLQKLRYMTLAEYVSLKPAQGGPLLLMSVRYFFQRQVEADPKLAASLTYQQLDGLTAQTRDGFRALDEALDRHGERLNALLTDLHDIVSETRDDVKEMKEELHKLSRLLAAQPQPAADARQQQWHQMQSEMERKNAELREMYEKAVQAIAALQSQAAVAAPPEAGARAAAPAAGPGAPRPGLAGGEKVPAAQDDLQRQWQQVHELVSRCHSLPADQKRQMPALFRAVTKLNLSGDGGNPFGLHRPAGTPAAVENEWRPRTDAPARDIPVYPEKTPDLPAVPADAPLGPAFQATPPATGQPAAKPATAGDPKAPAAGIFLPGGTATDPAPGDRAADPAKPAEAKPGQRRILSSLFGKKEAQPKSTQDQE